MFDLQINDLYTVLSGGFTGTWTGPMVWAVVALVLAIAGGIVLYYIFVKPKADPKNKTVKGIKDFLSFKTMCIESLLKIFYYIMTIYVILTSFNLIGQQNILGFIAQLTLSPIVIRIGYETAMILVKIWRNTEKMAGESK